MADQKLAAALAELKKVTAERDGLRQKVSELTAALNVSARERRSPFVTVGDDAYDTTYVQSDPGGV